MATDPSETVMATTAAPEENPIESTTPLSSADNVEEATEASESTEVPDNGWWGSWITAAKSKSAEVLGMVKKDLDELSTAVKSEATHVINSTSTAIGKTFKLDEPDSTANTMKKSLSTFLDQVNTVLNPLPDDEETETILEINGDYVTLPTYQKDLLALQKLDATYLIAPEGQALASMAAWLEASSRPSPSILEKHLSSSPVLKEKLERLVPHAATRDDFWERYLFRKALLEDKLAQIHRHLPATCTDAIVNSITPPIEEKKSGDPNESPSHSSVSSGDSARSNYGSSKSRSLDFDPSSTKDIDKIGDFIDDVAWENEEFGSNIQLTEEQQMKLLQEYESEIIANDKSKRIFTETSQSVTPENSTSTPLSVSPDSLKSDKASPKRKPVSNTKTGKVQTPNKAALLKPNKKSEPTPKKGDAKRTTTQKSGGAISNMKEDHFVDVKSTEKKSKFKSLSEEMSEQMDGKPISDNASNNSDESWEKEFEIDDLHISSK